MDQIKNKYRGFKNSIIKDEQIRYLYDEQDPSIVTTDQQGDQVSRPFKKWQDEHGVPGLLEVATNKFYYNLNIVVIEERLANGYYKRPKDFLADIRTLAKDAKTAGDRDRRIKANEMLANVEVDIATIEAEPQWAAECENIYRREMDRMKEKEEKAKRKAAAAAAAAVEAEPESQSSSLRIATRAATAGSSQPTQMLEPSVQQQQPQQQQQQPPPPPPGHTTPIRPSQNGSQLSNGYLTGPANLGERPTTQMSNGSSVPSRGDGEMHDGEVTQHGGLARETEQTPRNSQPSQPVFAGMSSTQQQERSAMSQPGGPNTQQRSQKTSLATMAPGSQLDDFANYASTTTSSKKTSDRTHSNRSSDRWNTQSSNGIGPAGRGRDLPDFSGVEARVQGDSQLPDTQGTFF